MRLFFLVILCLPLSSAWADDSLSRKTLRRRLDPIVVEGKTLGPMLGQSIDKLRLFAMRRGKLTVIPFQIDEKTPSGNYAFDKGADTKKDVDNGALDSNDELVFMVRDSGGQAPPQSLQSFRKVVEIRLTDPKDKRLAWVYLVAFKKKPPALADVDYVSIQFDKSGFFNIQGKDFITGNKRSLGNTLRSTSVRFREGSKRLSPNVIDCTKTRAKLFYFAISVERYGTEMRAVIGAYIDGPIRVLALNVVEVYLIWGFWIRSPNSLIKYYDYGSEMPMNIKLPINIDSANPASVARLSMDLSPRAQKWRFYNSWNLAPVKVDGVMSAKEKALTMKFPKWNVVYGGEGGIVQRLSFEKEEMTKGRFCRLFYKDALQERDEPENEQGHFGNSGFEIDLSGLKEGSYKGCYYTYFKKSFRYGDERFYLDIVDQPIKVKVSKSP